MKLSELKDNQEGIIVKVIGYGAFRKRITEMGFIPGKIVKVVKNAPLKDPVEYEIMGYQISLRRKEAAQIEVVTSYNQNISRYLKFDGIEETTKSEKILSEKTNNIKVALIGNPNAGKTTLFNSISGLKEHVGNYSGVTVDAKLAKVKYENYNINITDLPGTYSMSVYSPEEIYVRDYIIQEKPDIVINVIDASNLERNLYLTTQLIDMDIKLIIALNMYDELKKNGAKFNYSELGKMIGVPIIPTVGSKGIGISDLLKTTTKVYEEQNNIVRHVHINYGDSIEKSIKKAKNIIRKDTDLWARMSPRYLTIKLLEGDKEIQKSILNSTVFNELDDFIKTEQGKIEETYSDDCENIITDYKYGFISGALKETYKEAPIKRQNKTAVIDTFLTHKLFGFPLFFLFMFLTFFATFNFGKYPMEWIEHGVNQLSILFSNLLPTGPLRDLVVDGIIGGVGGVIVFLPNILILFLFISFMEDTGYMARAAFIMDKIMHKIGLHGKSFIPLIMGFGCNVPALMATRTLENKNDRLLTILIIPFMSCSARLPVYILIIGSFFEHNAGLILFIVYITGVSIAVLSAKLFKLSFFKSKEAPFVMELPPYRLPTVKTTLTHMWSKAVQYLQKMGGIILIASIVIWALGYFPRKTDFSKDYDKEIQNVITKYSNIDTNSTKDYNSTKSLHERDSIIHQLNLNKLEEEQESSYIGKIGKSLSPIFHPLGFDWKLTVSIFTGIAAKEVVVSTMGVLYKASEDSNVETESLSHKLKTSKFTGEYKTGELVFNKLTALSFLIFILIYFPCIAVIASIIREAGWKWAALVIVYTTGLAWILSYLINNIGGLFL
ncbi:MAG: ferrous iron transport protein B [Marinifilaceae bacterium]|jgi:ferrous iron transport protein B|nr:ferrous iron transport protein B [Marinifilaceae bacterium]